MPGRECGFPPEAEGSWGKILNMVSWRCLSLFLNKEYLEGSGIGQGNEQVRDDQMGGPGKQEQNLGCPG